VALLDGPEDGITQFLEFASYPDAERQEECLLASCGAERSERICLLIKSLLFDFMDGS
jgi:hypothetical protein